MTLSCLSHFLVDASIKLRFHCLKEVEKHCLLTKQFKAKRTICFGLVPKHCGSDGRVDGYESGCPEFKPPPLIQCDSFSVTHSDT